MDALLITMTTSCASQEQTESELASFVGRDIQSAITELGRPSGMHDMQDGTYEYVWRKTSRSSTTTSTPVFGIPVSKSLNADCSRILVTDRQKLVISYDMLGNC